MKVIDFRARPNTTEYMSLYTSPAALRNWEIRFQYPKPADVPLVEFIRGLDEQGIDKAVFTGRQATGRGIGNDYIASCVQQYPDRIVGIAGANAEAGEEGVRELERAITQLGLKGVSLDAHYARKPFSDDLYFPIYEKAQQLGVPVILTMGPIVGRFGSPEPVDVVAEQFPNLKIVCSHGIWPQVTEFLALAFRYENVYIEPSIYEFLPGGDLFVQFANDVMPEKIIYASAFPFRPLSDLQRFKRFPFKPEVLEQVLWKNAARLLKLEA